MREPLPSDPSVTERRQAADDLLANAVCALLVIASLTFALFRLGDGQRTRLDLLPSGRVLNVDRAVFFAANLTTGTGMPMSIVSPSDMPAAGRLAIALLTLAGVAWVQATALALLAGASGVRLGFWRVLQWTVGSILLGAIIARVVSPDIYDAASSATRLGWPASGPADPNGRPLLLGILPAALIGLLGPLLYGAIRVPGLRRGWLNLVACMCGVVLVGALIVAALEGRRHDAPLPLAMATAVNGATLGHPMLPLGDLTPATQALLVSLMLLGGLTAAALVALRSAKTRCVGLTWLVGLAAMVVAGQVTLLALSPETPVDRATLLVASAVSAVGLAHDAVGLSAPAMYTLAALMLAGRFWMLAMLWWLARAEPAASHPAST